MSRIKLLLDVVEDMRSLADSLQTMAGAIAGDEVTEPQPTEAVQESDPPVKALTKEQVRVVLSEKSSKGFTEEVKALLVKYGAQKLSGIDPGRYADLLRDVEELNDAGK